MKSFRLRGSAILPLINEAIRVLKAGHSFPDNIEKDEYVEMLEDKIIQLKKQVEPPRTLGPYGFDMNQVAQQTNLQNQGQLLQNQRTFGIIQDITGIGTIWPR